MIKTNKQAIRIIVVLLIAFTLVALWIIKKQDKTSDNMTGEITSSTNSQDEVNSITDESNPDFALEVKQVLELETLKSYGLPILLEFGADYCEPCRRMAPIIRELNSELQGKAIIKYIDVEVYPEAAQGFPVTVIPTQIFIDSDGNPYFPENPEQSRVTLYTHKETGEHLFTSNMGLISKEELIQILNEMGMKE